MNQRNVLIVHGAGNQEEIKEGISRFSNHEVVVVYPVSNFLSDGYKVLLRGKTTIEAHVSKAAETQMKEEGILLDVMTALKNSMVTFGYQVQYFDTK